jgi:hypothetical protein
MTVGLLANGALLQIGQVAFDGRLRRMTGAGTASLTTEYEVTSENSWTS